MAAPSAASNSPVAAPAEEAGDAGLRVHFEGAESWDFNVLLLSKDCACSPWRKRRARAECGAVTSCGQNACCVLRPHATSASQRWKSSLSSCLKGACGTRFFLHRLPLQSSPRALQRRRARQLWRGPPGVPRLRCCRALSASRQQLSQLLESFCAGARNQLPAVRWRGSCAARGRGRAHASPRWCAWRSAVLCKRCTCICGAALAPLYALLPRLCLLVDRSVLRSALPRL